MFSPEKSSRPGLFTRFCHLWFYFFVFTAANTGLAYFGSASSLIAAVSSVLLLLTLPPMFFYLLKRAPVSEPFYLEDTISPLSSKWFWIIGGLALLPRLYILFNPAWPIPDDGLNTYISAALSKNWDWHFSFMHSQIPPLNNWIQTLYFHCLTPSMLSMRFYYFVLSLAAMALGLMSAKIYFSRSMAFSCFFLATLSFWPLYTSRFCMYPQPLFTFQMLALVTLGLYLKSASPLNSWKLGLATGLGFWVAIQWPLAAFTITIAVFSRTRTKDFKTTFLKTIPFGTALGCFSIPFLLIAFFEKNNDHIKYLLSLAPEGGVSRLNSFLSNGTSLFWGCDLQKSYGPVWGGMLNPIVSSLFFIGFAALIQHRRLALPRWVLISLPLWMIPGLITGGFDIFRNALILPLVIFICALGAQTLIRQTAPRWRFFALTAVLLLSSGLDFIHLWKTYQPNVAAGSACSNNEPEFSKTFQLLKEAHQQKGPGLIFWGFNTDISDQTLDLATYPFNNAENPKLPAESASWAAWVANANYKPFLSDEFPKAQFYWLGPDGLWNQGGLMLVVLDKDDKNWPKLKLWTEVNSKFCLATTRLFLDPLNKNKEANFEPFSQAESLITGDRFLESIFYEKLMYLQRLTPDKKQLVKLLKTAVQKGYPAAHLLVTEGLLLKSEGDNAGAEKLLQEAMRSRLNLTDAQKNLAALESLKKTH